MLALMGDWVEFVEVNIYKYIPNYSSGIIMA